MLERLPYYREIWVCDFEFGGEPGERPAIRCMVAREVRSGRTIRLFAGEFGPFPPFDISEHALFVAFYASAELGCFRVLGWPDPKRILDLFVERKLLLNVLRRKGEKPPYPSLISTLADYGLNSIATGEKDEMRALAMRGPPYTDQERAALLDYCESDVDALARLLPAMEPKIELPHALIRGRYMAAAAAMEFSGVPIDRPMLVELREYWDDIKRELISRHDVFGFYDDTTFKRDRLAQYLIDNEMSWPVYPGTGNLDLRDDTLEEMARVYPQLQPIYELHAALSSMKLKELPVGSDDRNRSMLSAFGALTSRNTPSSSRFIFGQASFQRHLIKPPPGYGISYIDFEQQEFAIAAALSGDGNMLDAYSTGDCYLAFAKQAGAVPATATKQSHSEVRDQFKTCVLAVQYGMGARSLALRLGRSTAVANDLMDAHKRTYRKFWEWIDQFAGTAALLRECHTVFGWKLRLEAGYNARTLLNFPMQSNGAEMLRIACCLGTERGVEICAPIHDAALICSPLDQLDHDIARMQAAMAEASRVVLAGFEVRTEAKTTRHPERFVDPRGRRMWETVQQLIGELKCKRTAA